jgi:hypothetical protein
MSTARSYFREGGVNYRRDTQSDPLDRGETLLYYEWIYTPWGTCGRDFVVIPTANATVARMALAMLLDKWNAGAPGTWQYHSA